MEGKGWHCNATQIYPYLHCHNNSAWVYLLRNQNPNP
jgi:hypothetical protein